MGFRYSCYRDFKSYAGRVSAVYELIEIAVRQFEEAAKNSANEENFITESAKSFGLNVHFSSCPPLIAQTLALHIVNVHEAFVRYLGALRSEAGNLVHLQWKDYDKKDNLYIAIQNVFGSQKKGRERLGEMQVDLCGYYRLVRNSTIHGDGDHSDLSDAYAKVSGYREFASDIYETITSAPNPPGKMTRDDFQLFVRSSQDVAWAFSEALKPTEGQLVDSLQGITESFKKRWVNKPDRVRTAITSFLCKTYGFSSEAATKIAETVH